jgi:hypothetical protein
MQYEVLTHASRDDFQKHLQHLKPQQVLHSWQWTSPFVVAVYLTMPAKG